MHGVYGLRRPVRRITMKFKRSGIVIKIVILALIVYAAISLVTTKGKISQAIADQQQLQKQVDEALRENAGLQYDIDHAGDDETIEEIARSKLGLVKPGEKIFFDVSG